MKTALIITIAILTASLGGCATLTLDMPTQYGRISASTDGQSVLFGFKK